MGQSKNEVLAWDAEDIFKFLALHQREEDATAAYQTYILGQED